MIGFIIEIFCNDTITGLRDFEYIRRHPLFKNGRDYLFNPDYKKKRLDGFIDPIACRL